MLSSNTIGVFNKSAAQLVWLLIRQTAKCLSRISCFLILNAGINFSSACDDPTTLLLFTCDTVWLKKASYRSLIICLFDFCENEA